MRATLRGIGLFCCIAALSGCGGSSHHVAVHTSTTSGATSTTSQASYSDLIGAGDDLLKQHNYNPAEQVFRQAIAKDPHRLVGYYDLGLAYERSGQAFLAERAYRIALHLDLGYVPALNNLAFMLIAQNPSLANYYLQLLNHDVPHTPRVLLALGLSFAAGAHGGSPPSIAIKDLSEAVRLQPSLRAQIPTRLRRYLRTQRH